MPKVVRLNPKHDERTRAKIQTSQIINRLIKNINGDIEMTSSQVRSAEILLRKTLPDLQSVEYTLQDNLERRPIDEISDEEAARVYTEEMRRL